MTVYPRTMHDNIFLDVIEHIKEQNNGFHNKTVLDITFKFQKADMKNQFGTLTALVDDRFSKFSMFYKKICSHTVSRKCPDQLKPLSWVFLEPGGHRYANTLGPITDLHLHSVWVVDKSKIEAFQRVIEKALSMRLPHFTDIHVQNIDFTEENLENIRSKIGYNFKFDRISSKNPEIADLVHRYPKYKNDDNLMVDVEGEGAAGWVEL